MRTLTPLWTVICGTISVITLVACDDPPTLTGPDLESRPAAIETAVADRIAATVAALAPSDELLSRRAPYEATEDGHRVHDFGSGYFGLTLPLDDDNHGNLACSGTDVIFASCVKEAMDEGGECRTHWMGDVYNAECAPAKF